MKKMMESGMLNKKTIDSGYIYRLADNRYFSQPDFNEINDSEMLVDCYKGLIKGHIQLAYLTEQKKSINHLMQSLDGNQAIALVKAIIERVIYVKNHDVLNYLNLEISGETIFADEDYSDVKMMYLPLKTEGSDPSAKDDELRFMVIDLFTELNDENFGGVKGISEELLSGSKLSVEEMYNIVSGQKAENENKPDNCEPGITYDLWIRSEEYPEKCDFLIDKPEYIIGRNKNIVDGFVIFNPAIGRTHCKIIKNDMDYYVLDLGSVNGTFLNGIRLREETPTRIMPGDILRLADSNFIVDMINMIVK